MDPAVYTPVSAVANLRRSVVISVAIGVVAIVVSVVDGHPLAGMFGCIGLALGAVNNRMLQLSVLRRAHGDYSKKRFNGGVFGRLGSITALAVLCALVFRPDGLATFAGLAVFHVLMLIGAAVPVLRSLRWTV